MNYIFLINEYWRLNTIEPFLSTDTNIYFYLLNQCNLRHWENPFTITSHQIEVALNVAKKTVKKAIERLQKRGLLTVRTRRYRPMTVVLADNDIQNESQSDTTSGSTSVPVSGTHQSHIATHINKQKTINKKQLKKHSIECKKSESIVKKNEPKPEPAAEPQPKPYLDPDPHAPDPYKPDHDPHDPHDPMPHKPDRDPNNPHDPHNQKRHKPKPKPDTLLSVKINPCPRLEKPRSEPEKPHPEPGGRDAGRKRASARFIAFTDWVGDNAPYVAAHLKPLAEEEFDRLIHRFGPQCLARNIDNLENRRDLRQRYTSLYRTMLNWCAKDPVA